MRQPNIFVRFAGSPLIACLLIAGAALLIYGWYLGHTVWWLALAAIGAIFRTLSAVVSLHRYKAWAAEWQAMGPGGGAPASAHSPWKRMLLMGAALIAIPMMFSLPAIEDNTTISTGLHWSWSLLALYCLLATVRVVWRRSGTMLRRRHDAKIEKSLDDPITIAVGHAGDCPTRASAERNLPDYCLRLFQRN